jgi:hypothetical protein
MGLVSTMPLDPNGNSDTLASIKQPFNIFAKRNEIWLRKATFIRMPPELSNIIL